MPCKKKRIGGNSEIILVAVPLLYEYNMCTVGTNQNLVHAVAIGIEQQRITDHLYVIQNEWPTGNILAIIIQNMYIVLHGGYDDLLSTITDEDTHLQDDEAINDRNDKKKRFLFNKLTL
jgi:hypothetical protein